MFVFAVSYEQVALQNACIAAEKQLIIRAHVKYIIRGGRVSGLSDFMYR